MDKPNPASISGPNTNLASISRLRSRFQTFAEKTRNGYFMHCRFSNGHDCRAIQKSAEINDRGYYIEGFCGGSVWGIGKYEELWDGCAFCWWGGDYASNFYSSRFSQCVC